MLAIVLTGCGFVNDVFEGQRITTERLGVDSALRALTTELAAIDGVTSAVYSFDAVNVATSPGVEVTLADTEFALWDDVVTRIETAAETDALQAYPVSVALSSDVLGVRFDTRYGAPWLTEAALQVATRAASVFPGAVPDLSGISATDTGVYLVASGSAEDLLARLSGDAEVVGLLEAAREGHVTLIVSADGVDISGAPGFELLQWARERLASGVPLMPNVTEEQPPDEWMYLSIASAASLDSVNVGFQSSAEPGEHTAAWDAFVAALRAGPPTTASGSCVDTYVSLSWPGIANSAVAYAGCGEAAAVASTERPAVTALREALAAEGVSLEALGFTFG
jgi:hypothetical protein